MSGVPELSVVVVVYNIPREAPRTLFSRSAADYQRGIDRDEKLSSSITPQVPDDQARVAGLGKTP
ncbi:MAG: hypothetical protein DMF89_18795 [Acidobacteria bacterium]|nr:MAG: hypothetical protein DMF89_18795 [Acidobacteriota bacterium]